MGFSRFSRAIAAFLFAFFGWVAVAKATVHIHIDLSSQRMHVDSAQGSYTWPVSTARAGYSTPRGSFAPTGLQRMHYSKKYHNSPMPWSIFFRGGYAIHGTGAVGQLGSPASHGCVRLHPANAKRLYEMVQAEGGSISITGSPAGGGTRYAARRGHRPSALAYAAARHRRHESVRAWQMHPLRGLFGD